MVPGFYYMMSVRVLYKWKLYDWIGTACVYNALMVHFTYIYGETVTGRDEINNREVNVNINFCHIHTMFRDFKTQ